MLQCLIRLSVVGIHHQRVSLEWECGTAVSTRSVSVRSCVKEGTDPLGRGIFYSNTVTQKRLFAAIRFTRKCKQHTSLPLLSKSKTTGRTDKGLSGGEAGAAVRALPVGAKSAAVGVGERGGLLLVGAAV